MNKNMDLFMRKTKFQNEYYYHIYNRGVDKRDVFMDEKDHFRFLRSMREFNQIETIESLYRHDQLKRQEREEAKPLRFALANRRGLASFANSIYFIPYSLLLLMLLNCTQNYTNTN